MLVLAAARLAVAAIVLAGPQQKAPAPVVPADSTFPCDAEGVIRCRLEQVETVTGSRSLEDMRIISKYIQLVTERNRRYFIAWQTKAPSAAYELVKRVKAFPYLPYGDTYSIVGLEIVLNQNRDQLVVRYLKKSKQASRSAVSDGGFATYDTTLSDFIKTLQKEIEKLKKFDKAPGSPF